MGANKNQITNKDMGSFKVPFSKEPDERESIYQFLSEFDVAIAKLNKQLNKTKTIKKDMMKELFTGKTRLIKPEGGQS